MTRRSTRGPRALAALAFLVAAATASWTHAAEVPCGGLDPTRRAAVRRGMENLKTFFEGEEKRAALGTDAVSIFLELGETSDDAALRERALREARRLAAPLAKSYAAPKGLDSHDNLMGALWLLPDAGPLHLSRKIFSSLSSAVLSRLSGRDPDETYYGSRIDPARLDALDGDALFDLLLSAYAVERARLDVPELPAPALGLADVLRIARTRAYVSFGAGDDDRASDDFYLATHVAYVLTDYSRFRLRPDDLGPLLGYLRAQVPSVLASSDVEAAAEIADVLRQLGTREEDEDVCRLTRLLLATQEPDGSWRRDDPGDAYDTVHPTWVAVHALRARRLPPDGAWTRHVRALLPAPATPRVP